MSSRPALLLSLAVAVIPLPLAAQQPPAASRSLALESDAISYFIGGWSGIVNVSVHKFQVALGTGRYDVPSFLLEGEANYDRARWKATSTSVQVLRAGYRFRGPMKDGPALALVVLNQSWRVRSEPLAGETRFRPLSVGLSGGYYLHVGPHFYVYPTLAYTRNRVVSGTPGINGVPYTVERYAPNGSVHVGWEWRR